MGAISHISQFLGLKRPRIRTVFILVNLIVITIPISGAYFFRIYENELVRQTEMELIAQGAYISAMYKHFIPAQLKNTYGIRLENPPPKLDEIYRPVLPQINLTRAALLPPRPDGIAPPTPSDKTALAIGKQLEPIIEEARLTTMAGISLMDNHGTVIAGTKEIGLSLAQTEEVQAALQGRYASVIRIRIPKNADAPPAVASISRGSHIRIFVAIPIAQDDRLVGAVLLSRSPRNILKALYYEQREAVVGTLSLLIAAVLLIGLLTSYAINQPVQALLHQIKRIESGAMDIQTIEYPITREFAELSEQIAHMAAIIRERSDYIRQFATHVSHEFKTPLTAIQGAIELLKDHGGSMSDEERNKFMRNVMQDTDRLKKLVSRLLELAKADAMQPLRETCNAIDVIEKLAARYRTAGLAVQWDNTSSALEVPLPGEVLETTFVNLLDNSRQSGATEVSIVLSQETDAVRIRIRDNGNGMSEANAQKLFTPFFTTHRERGGTGLGLSIVQSLLSTYRATIVLTQHAPHAEFAISIPT